MSRSRPTATLIVDPLGAYAEIEVLDGDLNAIALPHNVGPVEVQVEPGAYAVRFRAGDEVKERLVVVAEPGVTTRVELDPSEGLPFATSAPVQGTRTSRKEHEKHAARLSHSRPRRLTTAERVGHLMLFARDAEETRTIHPKDLGRGILVLDLAGEPVVDLGEIGERSRPQNWAGAHVALPPGGYRLRLPAGPEGGDVEQMIFLAPDWQTQVFLHGRGLGRRATSRRIDPARTSILMARPDQGFDPARDDLRRTEASLQALAAGRDVSPPPRLEHQTLWAKYQNPILGMYGAHLHLRRETISPELMRKVVRNLLSLVGPLPDVVAIGWGALLRAKQSKAELRRLLKDAGPVEAPPLLAASWAWLVRATAEDRTIIVPGSLADRVAGRPLHPSPWLVWVGPVETRDEFEKDAAQIATAVPARQAAAQRVRPRGSFLQRFKQEVLDPFLQQAAHWGLDKLLARIASVLDTDPDARYLIDAPRFSDLERRVARFASPLADPMIRDLVRRRPKLRQRLVRPYLERTVDERELVQQVAAPVGTVLRTALRLQFLLTMKPIVPRRAQVSMFVTKECQGYSLLRAVLESLRNHETGIRHGGSGSPVDMLEFLFLCYRDSPAADHTKPPGNTALATLLRENGYVRGEGEPITAATIGRVLRDTRGKVRDALGRRVRRGRRGFPRVDAPWIDKAVPPPSRYVEGRLFAEVPSDDGHGTGPGREGSGRGSKTRR